MFKKFFKIDELYRFIRFGLVGVSNTGVDFIVFYFFANVVLLNVYYSQILAYSIATLNSYLLNKNWTFKTGNNYNVKEIIKFLLVNLTSLLTSLVLMFIFNDLMSLDKMVCKVLIACFTIFINYFGNRLWVFKKQ